MGARRRFRTFLGDVDAVAEALERGEELSVSDVEAIALPSVDKKKAYRNVSKQRVRALIASLGGRSERKLYFSVPASDGSGRFVYKHVRHMSDKQAEWMERDELRKLEMQEAKCERARQRLARAKAERRQKKLSFWDTLDIEGFAASGGN